MDWQAFFIKTLRAQILASKRQCRGLSDRAIAATIGATSGELSEILARKRSVSFEKAISLLKAIETPEHLINNLYRMSGVPLKIERSQPQHSIQDQTDVFICALAEIANEPLTAESLSISLRISKKNAETRLKRLVNDKILELDQASGRYSRLNNEIDLNQNLSISQLKKLKSSAIESAQTAAQNMENGKGVFLNLTFLGSSKDMKRYTNEIINFLNSLSTGMSQSGRNEIMQISVQAFSPEN